MTEPVIRPATAKDIAAFYGAPQHNSMRAYIAELDGRPIAIAGVIYHHGKPVFFSEMKPEMRGYRKAVIKGARAMLAALKIRAPAIADIQEPHSEKLLKLLGFVHVGQSSKGNIFEFRGE